MSQTQVQSGFIGDNSVTSAQIAANAITTAKLDSTISNSLVPIGGIIMWSGSVATIPSSWRLCDGNNGTPNLQDKFLVGAGSGYAVGATGGSANATLVSHSHTMQSGGANGTFSTYSYNFGDATGAFSYNITNARALNPGNSQSYIFGTLSLNASHTHTIDPFGSSATNANLPPYYALAFIMRVS